MELYDLKQLSERPAKICFTFCESEIDMVVGNPTIAAASGSAEENEIVEAYTSGERLARLLEPIPR